MTILRTGLHGHSGPGVISTTSMGGGAAVFGVPAWSLFFDGVGDWVDCGNNASVMDLHASDFTVDAYIRTPASGQWVNFLQYNIMAQGNNVAGWRLYVNTFALPNIWFVLAITDGVGVKSVFRAVNPISYETWYYLRGRRQGNNIYLSVNAAAEGVTATAAGGTLSALNLFLGRRSDNVGLFIGSECYVHLWNNNQGALGAVPATPFALGVNTAARYRFTDGAGATLTDDSGNGNNGTIAGATWQPIAPVGWIP